jgi:hypothetical protein
MVLRVEHRTAELPFDLLLAFMRHSAIRALGTIREAASESSPFIRTVARTVGNSGIANAGNIAEQVRKELRISSFEGLYRIPASSTMAVGKRLEDYFAIREEQSLYLTHVWHPYIREPTSPKWFQRVKSSSVSSFR